MTRARQPQEPETAPHHDEVADAAGVTPVSFFRPVTGVCHYCSAPATTRDHIVPASKRGVNRWWNLVGACMSCNASRGSRLTRCRCEFCVRAVQLWRSGYRRLGKSRTQLQRNRIHRRDVEAAFAATLTPRIDWSGEDTAMTDTTVLRRKPRTWALMDYDKKHRCPSWSGAGWKLQPEGTFPPCEGGYMPIYDVVDAHPYTWQFRTVQCPKCGVKVLPHALIALTWYWWKAMLPREIGWAIQRVRHRRRR